MIYPEHIQEYVEFYCKSHNIPIIQGRVCQQYKQQIEKIIALKMRSDRSHTRRIENEREGRIASLLPAVLDKVSILESPIEDYLYKGLIEIGLSTHCQLQYQIGKYRVDFAFPDARLVVECDGKKYHFTESWQMEKDQKRDKYLARKGWRVLHIEGLAIRRHIDLCLKKITDNLRGFIDLDYT